MPNNHAVMDLNQSQQAALAALASANDLLMDEIDRQLADYSDRIQELQRQFALHAPKPADLAKFDAWDAEMAKLRARKREIILLEFATMDSSTEVANLIGKVGSIRAALEAERVALGGMEERVQNIGRLIRNVDGVLRNLLTIATLFA